MTISLKHTFQSAKSDGTDSTLVQPSNWNAEHTITLAAGKVLGRDSSGNGAMQELPLSFDTSGNMSMSATGSFVPAVGTTLQRPASPVQGMVRFNTTSTKFELYNGTIWGSVGGGATISDTAPSSPAAGDLWWKSDEGQMYVYYTDANSSQWVVANAYAGGAAYLPLAGGQVTGNVGIGAGTGSGYRVAIAGSVASAVPLYLHSDATNAYVYSSSPLIVGSTGNYSTFLVANNGVKFIVGTLGQFGIGAANAIGTSGQVLTSGGSSAAPTWTTPTGGFSNMAVGTYTAASNSTGSSLVWNSNGSLTWTVPTGITTAKVTVVAGGGGGGGNSQGSGGGAGGVSIRVVTGLTPGGTVAVTVGVGGAGSAAGTGTTGGASSFGAYATTTGGGGGSVGGGNGAGGTGSSGTLNLVGGIGANPGVLSVTFGCGGSTSYMGGNGGNTIFGGAGRGAGNGTGSAGATSTGGGGGGGGGATAAGFAGGSGVVIIEW